MGQKVTRMQALRDRSRISIRLHLVGFWKMYMACICTMRHARPDYSRYIREKRETHLHFCFLCVLQAEASVRVTIPV